MTITNKALLAAERTRAVEEFWAWFGAVPIAKQLRAAAELADERGEDAALVQVLERILANAKRSTNG